MYLHISSPSEKRDIDIAWIEFNTPVGNFVVQPEHAPMVVSLMPMSYVHYRLTTGKEETKKVIQGVIHVKRDGVTLLVTQ